MNGDPAPGKPAATFDSGAGTPGTERRASGRDGYPGKRNRLLLFNMEFDDFGARSEQLSGHGQAPVAVAGRPNGSPMPNPRRACEP